MQEGWSWTQSERTGGREGEDGEDGKGEAEEDDPREYEGMLAEVC